MTVWSKYTKGGTCSKSVGHVLGMSDAMIIQGKIAIRHNATPMLVEQKDLAQSVKSIQ